MIKLSQQDPKPKYLFLYCKEYQRNKGFFFGGGGEKGSSWQGAMDSLWINIYFECPVVISRDHHDVSGTDSPFRETADIYDGSSFCAGNCFILLTVKPFLLLGRVALAKRCRYSHSKVFLFFHV